MCLLQLLSRSLLHGKGIQGETHEKTGVSFLIQVNFILIFDLPVVFIGGGAFLLLRGNIPCVLLSTTLFSCYIA